MKPPSAPSIVIACGGTGGHLFPGLAVAEHLVRRGYSLTLFVSPKVVDRQALRTAHSIEVVTLPAVGLSRGRSLAFLRGFVQSYRAVRKHFKARPPHAALAMGGFTGAPPILAAKRTGAPTFLHESNAIPGRANRWLAHAVDAVFVGFPQTAARLPHRRVLVTGTPVRRRFQPRDAYPCRVALGLDPARPVLLVMGGSQGAGGINDLITRALPLLVQNAPELQLLHLAGSNDAEKITQACRALKLKAVVHSFFNEMELVLGATTVAISRAGASSLAELAAMRVPALLVPYPAARDNHQWHNARAFEQTGAARLLEQPTASPETLTRFVLELLGNAAIREQMQAALAQWHSPKAAEQIAEEILKSADADVCAGQSDCEVEEPSCPPAGAVARGKSSAT
jgi:UDP-N-acetylglucosamine--N-acetylmuramyl-(pentapeptide) pyrophosphoryl-undecaprenol N-acetylglucosamine transferase